MAEQSQNTTSPRFYRNAAVLFFVIGGVLLWAAITRHDWVYWAFAAITILNALMSVLKLKQVRETKS
jgi:membrane protein YdbS with pleckstrin-like domain